MAGHVAEQPDKTHNSILHGQSGSCESDLLIRPWVLFLWLMQPKCILKPFLEEDNKGEPRESALAVYLQKGKSVEPEFHRSHTHKPAMERVMWSQAASPSCWYPIA